MVLSEEERRRFADYLEQSASFYDRIGQQIAQLGETPVMRELLDRLRLDSDACRVVVKILRATQ